MKDKEKDKRLIIPGDAFEEEASEGLGRLSREEAEADLRDLKGRMERRLRKPRMIWLPAAAAVVILLVASALYVSVFRDRSAGLLDLAGAEETRSEEAKADSLLIALAGEAEADTDLTAMTDEAMTDTLMIAMATPIEKRDGLSGLALRESRAKGDISSSGRKAATKPGAADTGVVVTPEEADAYAKELLAVAEDVKKEAEAEEVSEVVVAEARQEEPMAEEVIVEAVPMMQKAALRTDNATKEKAAAMPGAVMPGAVMPDRNALPVGGWEEYREWMAPNIRYPEGVDPVERQVIVVTFRVRADSTVYDLKAERTPGDLFTREAFRLISEGPQWQPAVRGGQAVEEEVRVSIVFK